MSKLLTDLPAPVATVCLIDGRTVGDDIFANYANWLNKAEVERFQRFVRRERQRQFLVGRLLLRLSLGRLLDVRPDKISLVERPSLAPQLNCAEPVPGYSLSHSGPWIACAVSVGAALGLDIEVINPARDLNALSEQVFEAEEIARIKEQTGEARVATFYKLWSIKEASYKLASASVLKGEQNCIALPHPEISIVLCSSLPLAKISLQPVLSSDLSKMNW